MNALEVLDKILHGQRFIFTQEALQRIVEMAAVPWYMLN